MDRSNQNDQKPEKGISRRRFVENVATVAGVTLGPRNVLGGAGYQAPSDKLNIAAVGAGGMGFNNINRCAEVGENIVALCDVDEQRAAKTFQMYPNVPRYKDFRVMLEKQKDIDAVIVATPDHGHALIAMAAMQLGKHVYVQKPLTRTVGEARKLTEAARRYKVATQMGNQGHSMDGVRLVSEWIWDGAIGPVREVHIFTNRPVWPGQGFGRPKETPPVPSTLDWDLWLVGSPYRPYHPAYVPHDWRAWRDFGAGALGDMGCHLMDTPFTALKLKYPIAVEASTAEMCIEPWKRFENNETFPIASVVHYTFPAREDMPEVKLHWYDGGILPERPEELGLERRLDFGDGGGAIFVGDKGKIVCGTYGDSPRIIPESKMREYKRPPMTLPRIRGTHEQNWIEACKGGPPATSNFDYSGPFTETVVMGNLAVLFPGQKLLWDGENMRVTNLPEANEYVMPKYREGWSL
ncbi:MAG TPA: Gfo/Idh/MocA family oxidoreductase [Acidobacteriota bacterium]|nr:Gfo/Idh/MocA family oxidoreductase [Acidobacteriota bacterium]